MPDTQVLVSLNDTLSLDFAYLESRSACHQVNTKYNAPLCHQPSEDDHALTESIVEAGSSSPHVNALTFEPGTLNMFKGSRSLHRVSEVEGDRNRYGWTSGRK